VARFEAGSGGLLFKQLVSFNHRKVAEASGEVSLDMAIVLVLSFP
jgi:hypothetical protein